MFFAISCKKDKVDTACESNSKVKFSEQIKPMIQANCIACHAPGMTSPNLSSYESVSLNATIILNSMNATAGYELMPKNGPALNDSLISNFSCWISQGKLNN